MCFDVREKPFEGKGGTIDHDVLQYVGVFAFRRDTLGREVLNFI
jgi:hypothetical protein